MRLPKIPPLREIKKTLGALAVMTTSAVGFGVIDSATAGVILGGIGVITTGVVYVLDNADPPKNPAQP